MRTELLGEEPPGDGRTAGATSAAADTPGMIGRYRLVEKLGEGGMGVVHLALDPHGKAVALKVLRPHVAEDHQARQRLGREVATMSRVRSPRVATVLDADVEAPQPYIVTRYIPGPSLDEVVRADGPMAPEALLRLARGLAEALHAIHDAGIVHRDVKPGNVLLLEGDPVLIDFGIAHLADDHRLTQTGLVMGTPGYLAPELVEGADVSPGTDWWGWASSLAFAASGRPPFGRGSMEAVLSRVVRGDANLEGVDPLLAPLLAAALCPRPQERPNDREVVAALERYAIGRPVTEVLHHLPRTPPPADRTQAYQASATAVFPAAQGDPRPQPAYPPQPPAYPPPAHQTPIPAPPAYPPPAPVAAGGGDPRIHQPRRTGVLAALLALLAVGAAAAPLLTLIAAVAWSWLARTVDRTITGLVLRRHHHGRRGSDVPRALATAPWHLVASLLETAFTLILPLVVALATALSVAMALTALDGGSPQPWTTVPMAAGGLMGALMGWWGAGGPSLRRGSRTMVRAVTPTTSLALVVGVLVCGAALVIGAGALLGQSPTWWPLVDSPIPQVLR